MVFVNSAVGEDYDIGTLRDRTVYGEIKLLDRAGQGCVLVVKE